MAENGWPEYQNLVLKELDRLNNGIQSIEKRLGKIEIEIALLKMKSGLWGLVAGSIPATLLILYTLFKTKLGIDIGG